MKDFFSTIQVGDVIETRITRYAPWERAKSRYAPWERAKCILKDGDSITFQSGDDEITTDAEEVNDADYYRPVGGFEEE